MTEKQLITHLTELISSALQANSNSENAIKMAAYMKHFPFYGVKSPARTDLFKPIWALHKEDIKSHYRPLISALWKKQQREYQMISMLLLGKCQKGLTKQDLPWVKELITTKSWWDTVDYLASNTVGYILRSDKTLARSTANQFYETGELWLQRTALLFQLKYRGQVDTELLYSLIDQSLDSEEFFIRKACGWALRQYSKYNPLSVSNYMEANKSNMSKLTWREGSKYL